MPDYKEMYLTMVRETEKAVRLIEPSLNILIAAQQNCEEMYINSPEPVIQLLDNGLEPKKRRAGKAGNTAPYEDRDHWIAYMDAYFKDYQERFT